MAQVVILSDSTDKTDFICSLIDDRFDCLNFTTPQTAASNLDQNEPYIFLYSYNNCDEAEATYLEIFQLTGGLLNIRHKNILLCAQNETRQAYNLCKELSFDFFITACPQFDRYEISFYIEKNITRLELEETLFDITEQSITLFDEPGDVTNDENYENLSGKQITALEDNLSHDIGEFSQELESENYQPMLTLKQPDNFRISFNSDVRKIIHDRFTEASKLASQNKPKQTYFNDYLKRQQQTTNKKKSSQPPSDQFIMMIDDDPTTSNELAAILKQQQYHVMRFSNGRTALGKMLSQMPGLILLNHQVSGMEASAIIRMGKIMHKGKLPPVIVYTSNTTRQKIAELMNTGATSVISLPFVSEKLLQKINAALLV